MNSKILDDLYEAVLRTTAAFALPPGAGKIDPLVLQMMQMGKPPVASFMGINVYENPMCKRRVPMVPHKHKQHRRSVADLIDGKRPIYPTGYHERIQKKWIKRYGMKDEHVMYMLGHSIMMVHPVVVETMKKHATIADPMRGFRGKVL